LADPASRAAGVEKLQALSKSLDIGVLGKSTPRAPADLPHTARELTSVNNAGTSHEMPVAFAETTPEELESIVQVVRTTPGDLSAADPQNTLGTLQVTRAILPSLIARSSGRGKPKSLILNVGSLSGRIPSSLLATYSCTKGGLQTWTKALAEEVKKQGVVVTMVQPAFVVRICTPLGKPAHADRRSQTCPRSDDRPPLSRPRKHGSDPPCRPSACPEVRKDELTSPRRIGLTPSPTTSSAFLAICPSMPVCA